MLADYDPTTPIEKYIARIEKCMDIVANGGAPYSQEQLLTLAFDAMYCTGLYNEKCIVWEDMAPADLQMIKMQRLTLQMPTPC
eukprot:6866155-Ditylum_brightwellii.AAC.1